VFIKSARVPLGMEAARPPGPTGSAYVATVTGMHLIRTVRPLTRLESREAAEAAVSESLKNAC
jgi:hypothetical protein